MSFQALHHIPYFNDILTDAIILLTGMFPNFLWTVSEEEKGTVWFGDGFLLWSLHSNVFWFYSSFISLKYIWAAGCGFDFRGWEGALQVPSGLLSWEKLVPKESAAPFVWRLFPSWEKTVHLFTIQTKTGLLSDWLRVLLSSQSGRAAQVWKDDEEETETGRIFQRENKTLRYPSETQETEEKEEKEKEE